MKTTFGNRQLIHVWAQRTQPYGGTTPNGNLHFDGSVLVSYRTPIAHIVDYKGRVACLITTHSYSVTTSGKHTPHDSDLAGMAVFRVPFVGACGGQAPDTVSWKCDFDENNAPIHAANVESYAARYMKSLEEAARARQSAEFKFNWAAELRDEALGYVGFFELPYTMKELKTLFPPIDATKLEEVKAKVKKLQAEKLQRQKAARAEAEKAWRSFEKNTIPRELVGPCLLRITGDKVQTSQGAEFPIDHAKKAFPFIERIKNGGKAYDRGDAMRVSHLGAFKIDTIDSKGNVKAGCHYVEWSEIERAARFLGLVGG